MIKANFISQEYLARGEKKLYSIKWVDECCLYYLLEKGKLDCTGCLSLFEHLVNTTFLNPWDFYVNLLLKVHEGFIIKPL